MIPPLTVTSILLRLHRASAPLFVVALALVGLACATTPAQRVRSLLQEQSTSSSLLYVDAVLAAEDDPERALADLQTLERNGWNNPLAEHDFKSLTHDPRWQVLAHKIAARAPQVQAASIAFVVPECDLFPEGIAIDSRDGSLYLSSLWRRKITKITSDGHTQSFASDRLYKSIGMHVDEQRNLLWAAIKAPTYWLDIPKAQRGDAWLVALNLTDGTVVTRIKAPGKGPHLLNDLALANDGTVYVSDTQAGAVYSLAPGEATLQTFVAPHTLFEPNGIVVDDQQVLVAHAWGITRFARDQSMSHPIASSGSASEALGGIDGMALAGDQLYAVQNALGQPRIVQISLDPSHTHATGLAVLENRHPALALPTTLALDRRQRSIFIVADSRLDQLRHEGPLPGQRPTSTILKLPLP